MRGHAIEGLFTGAPPQRDATRQPTGQSLTTQMKVVSILSFLIPRTVLSTREQLPEGLFTKAVFQRQHTP